MHKLTPLPAFILATNESDVFPCRSLLDLNGCTVLEFITRRLKKAKGTGEIIICTSTNSFDDSVAELSGKLKLKVVRGSYDDVIGRLIQAYDEAGTETGFVIRGDAPLIDSHFCDELLKLHNSKASEFTYSEHLFGLPYGTGCEIVNKKVLTAMKEFKVSSYS
jgi:spore coat polysaccharide biosynthesis protein SpsF (cytidylyltransferase family)